MTTRLPVNTHTTEHASTHCVTLSDWWACISIFTANVWKPTLAWVRRSTFGQQTDEADEAVPLGCSYVRVRTAGVGHVHAVGEGRNKAAQAVVLHHRLLVPQPATSAAQNVHP